MEKAKYVALFLCIALFCTFGANFFYVRSTVVYPATEDIRWSLADSVRAGDALKELEDQFTLDTTLKQLMTLLQKVKNIRTYHGWCLAQAQRSIDKLNQYEFYVWTSERRIITEAQKFINNADVQRWEILEEVLQGDFDLRFKAPIDPLYQSTLDHISSTVLKTTAREDFPTESDVNLFVNMLKDMIPTRDILDNEFRQYAELGDIVDPDRIARYKDFLSEYDEGITALADAAADGGFVLSIKQSRALISVQIDADLDNSLAAQRLCSELEEKQMLYGQLDDKDLAYAVECSQNLTQYMNELISWQDQAWRSNKLDRIDFKVLDLVIEDLLEFCLRLDKLIIASNSCSTPEQEAWFDFMKECFFNPFSAMFYLTQFNVNLMYPQLPSDIDNEDAERILEKHRPIVQKFIDAMDNVILCTADGKITDIDISNARNVQTDALHMWADLSIEINSVMDTASESQMTQIENIEWCYLELFQEAGAVIDKGVSQ
jgi:hypothetical protein